ncbi:MAG: hypothetical protein COB53_01305 [Elusimicrobia bacterium]|nr:MAG: hypothetical protein COB53_01305 [Elusimicrobiota bacterium]
MLTVIVPCLNEAEGLQRLEEGIYNALKEDFEVLAIDDGSTDGTRAGLDEVAKRRNNFRVFHHDANQGIGASLKTGIREAQGEWLVFLDADLTFAPEKIAALIKKQLETGADCVSGSPLLGGMPGIPFVRRLPSLLMNVFYRGLFDQSLTSFTPMFRLYRTADLREIRINSDGFEVSVEILVRLLRAGKKVAEIPVPLLVRQTGTSKLQRWRELRAHGALTWRLLTQAR